MQPILKFPRELKLKDEPVRLEHTLARMNYEKSGDKFEPHLQYLTSYFAQWLPDGVTRVLTNIRQGLANV
ncbi:MAG: hypothetical protein VKM97_07860, partial [Cyanobacteriota bacterium]|nr:hypothetical protein [Cyanobacteriota bacterium]